MYYINKYNLKNVKNTIIKIIIKKKKCNKIYIMTISNISILYYAVNSQIIYYYSRNISDVINAERKT
jgi:phosphoribosyl-AMP cyclohydrolase